MPSVLYTEKNDWVIFMTYKTTKNILAIFVELMTNCICLEIKISEVLK